MSLPWDQNWEKLYDALGIRDFIYFISSPSIQDTLFPVKLIFIIFGLFFLCAVIYFYLNSSYLRNAFIEDYSEFFSWQAYGLKAVDKKWKSITKKIITESEKEYKLAMLEADEFLFEEMQDAEFSGGSFEEMLNGDGRRLIQNRDEILEAHKIRNLIVHNTNYSLDVNLAKRMMGEYEKAIKSIYSY